MSIDQQYQIVYAAFEEYSQAARRCRIAIIWQEPNTKQLLAGLQQLANIYACALAQYVDMLDQAALRN